jgi:hypothetical protein
MNKNRIWLSALPVCAVMLLALPACGIEQLFPPRTTTLPTLTPVPTPVPEVLFVDASQGLGTINPYVYGANFGPWVGVPVDLMDEADQAGITYLRFPGGQWGDQNDLKDYQIDRFISLALRLGAEPKINVRLAGGSPDKAAEMVRYCNITNDYNVRYWSIGNEPSLYTNIYGDYDTEMYNKEWREFAEAMRAVDPEIILIGPEIHQYTGNPETDPRDAAGRDWTREFLIANGDLVDIVAIHRYPFPTSMTGPPKTIDDLRANSREWETIIPNLRALIRETTGRDLPVAVTEINSDWSHATGGDATPDSFYNAIWWGDVLGRLIRQRVDIVAYFLLQSQTRTGGWGLLARFEVRPTYYVYQMYKQFGDELLYASSDDPDVSIFAARRAEDDAITIMIINLSPEEKRKPLVLEDGPRTERAKVWLFDAAHNAERIEAEGVSNGGDLILPPQSISLHIYP